MSDIAKIIGQRIRNYRTQKGLSQEKLAELAGCHPTYIGQLERGEKNATLESVEKIAKAGMTALRPNAMIWSHRRPKRDRRSFIKCCWRWTNTGINKKAWCRPKRTAPRF